jgi:hypothetical protein
MPQDPPPSKGEGAVSISPTVSLEAGGDAIFVRPHIDASVHIGSQTNVAGDLILQIPEVRPSVSPEELVEKARHLLCQGLYSECEAVLRQVLAADYNHAEAHAYLVPCLLRGRNASQVSQRVASEVEAHLRAASSAPAWRGFALAAWILFKHDRFVLNGMSEGEPRLEALVAQFREVTLSPEESSLLRHVHGTSSARRLLGLS